MTSTIICCSDEVNGSGCFHWLIVAVLTDQPEWSLNTDDDNDVRDGYQYLLGSKGQLSVVRTDPGIRGHPLSLSDV